MLCISPYVQFIDNQVLHGKQGLLIVAPVKIILHHPGFITLPQCGRLAPQALSGHGLGIGVQKVFILVENKPLLRLIRPLHPVGIFKFPNTQLKYNHGIHIPNPVMGWEWQDSIGLILCPPE